MKKLLGIVGILVIVLIVAAIAVGLFIGPIAKAGIENLGPKITKVPIKVDAVNVSLMTGSAEVKGLIVGNPAGFNTPQAMSLGNASVKLDPGSVFSDKIVAHAIHIEAPEIFFEGGLTGNNLSKLLENVNASAATGGPAAPGDAKTKTEAGGQKAPPKIQVDDFLISGAKTHINLSLPGVASESKTLTLPEIHLTNLGQGRDGITMAELVKIVLTKLTAATIEEVTKSAASSGKVLENLGKDIGGEGGTGINAIKKGIGGLLGN